MRYAEFKQTRKPKKKPVPVREEHEIPSPQLTVDLDYPPSIESDSASNLVVGNNLEDQVQQIAEILTVLGKCQTEDEFILSYLGLKPGVTKKIKKNDGHYLTTATLGNLRMRLNGDLKLARRVVVKAEGEDNKWRARAHRNHLRMAIHYFDALIGNIQAIELSA